VHGESGHPGLEKVRVRVYLASSEEETAIHRLWHEMLATSPLVHTFQAAIQFELTLQVVV
jgi:hypothetical protein